MLMDRYFSACHHFIPVYDPSIDTWDSLRHRSPFSVSVMMMIGKRVEDAGGACLRKGGACCRKGVTDDTGPTSDVQIQCRDNAELIGKSMVFSPVANIEALQALIVFSCWGDTVWRPGRKSPVHILHHIDAILTCRSGT
jgi:hypothetical protein